MKACLKLKKNINKNAVLEFVSKTCVHKELKLIYVKNSALCFNCILTLWNYFKGFALIYVNIYQQQIFQQNPKGLIANYKYVVVLLRCIRILDQWHHINRLVIMVFSVLSLIVVELIRVSKMLHFVSMEFNVCILIPNLKSHFFIFASFNILVLFSVQILIV